jgi:3-hydroxybutyryl-CoA dehydrogenase
MTDVPAIVGVLGGGRMGAGIAHAFVVSGSSVRIVERDDDQAAAALDRVTSALAASVERGTTGESLASLNARIETGTDDALFDECELVIEAVPEDTALKIASLARIEDRVGAEIPIASNTSSLSIDALAASLRFPQRFLGLHFFNPVPASELVEIVVGASTDPTIVSDAQDWVAAIGKTPVTVKDSPGFASSRLGVAIGLEAIRMLEEGVASAEDIDAAMVLGYKFPVGPLRLTDIVGLDVRLGIAEYLHSQLGERFAPPQLLRDKVAAGELGRKTGSGFFRWDDSPGQKGTS